MVAAGFGRGLRHVNVQHLNLIQTLTNLRCRDMQSLAFRRHV